MDKIQAFLRQLLSEIRQQWFQLTFRQQIITLAVGVGGIVLLIGLVIFLASDKFPETDSVDPAFQAYISSYSSGVLSVESPVRVRLTTPAVDSTQVGQLVRQRLFQFAPEVEGEAYWADQQTIEFLPTESLKSGQRYRVNFDLEEVQEVPDAYESFAFSFQTIQQNYSVELVGLTAKNENELVKQELHGILLTADAAPATAVEQMLSAQQADRPLSVRWEHATDNRSHSFVIDEVVRQEDQSSVVVQSSGEPLSLQKSPSFTVDVPARSTFKLLNYRVVEVPEQYLELRFSDPLQPSQSLDGLIQLNQRERDEEDFRFIVDKNIVKMYLADRLTGTRSIIVNEGIRNTEGKSFPTTVELDVEFEAVKPAVRLLKAGVILPTTQGMVLPFEAVNLKSVDVTVVRVFEKNIAQFFQVNQYDGQQELRRVGQPVAQQEIPLNGSGVTDLGKWNRFTLDLQKLIEAEPGAVYQVIIGFRQHQAISSCENQSDQNEEYSFFASDDWSNADRMFWESYGDYYYTRNYNWEERDNPCSSSYYGGRRSVRKNLLVSNLGLIAKKEGDRQYRIAATNLQTTEPQSGVAIKLLDLQQQVLAEGSTDSDGWWQVAVEKQPFLAVAEENGQKSYLRLDDGTALSLSNFDVAGQLVAEGIKGFLYGDRGVWRPGDSLHLNFILEDRTERLPPNHPVVFELSNPQGQTAQRIVRTDHVGGIYNFSTATDPGAITGSWLAKVMVGGASFTKTVRIETVKPNRLRADLDFGTFRLLATDQRLTADLSVAWLNGATARNLRAQYELLLTPRPTTFAQYPGYHFDDPTAEFERERKEVFDGRVNSEGNASFQVDLSTEGSPPGRLDATFIGKVFEEGGNFSTDQQTLPYYPYRSYVGMKVPEGQGWGGSLNANKAHPIDVVVVDASGRSISGNDLEVSLYELEWRWWWDQSDRSLAQYVNNTYRKPIQSDIIDALDGTATWQLKVADNTWGRYLLRVCDPESGHCTGKIIYLDSPYAREGEDQSDGATMLTFSSDQDSYQVEEEATLYLPAQAGSRFLISLENGSQILETNWLEVEESDVASDSNAVFTFEVTEAMVPNVYANVTMLQPHKQTANDLPIRMYGAINLSVENPETHLEPMIEIPTELEPEGEMTINVSEANEREMAYTVAVVDEGLLDITNFATPQPHTYFYAREALGVKTWDLYDYVIGAYGGELERILAVGGDAELAEISDRKANRFSPVVKFLGPFYLDDDEVNEHTFTLPNYVGSVRVMVVAAYEGAYGSADTTTTVSKPLMVLGTLPRVLSPGEEVQLPVTVFAMDNSVKDVRINVNTNTLINHQRTNSREMFFSVPGDRITDFSLKTTPQVGIGEVQINAAAGPNRADYTIELDIRNPNPPITQAITKIIPKGTSWNAAYEAIGVAGTNQAVLEVSNILPLNLSQRLEYLIRYPHGCIEQTVSAAFPQLYLNQIEELAEEEQLRIENNVKQAIARLNSFLTNEGAFAYWPGSQDADEWSTSYAGHFLLEAQQQGYAIPVGLMQAWQNYQRRRANQWGAGSGYVREELIQAYRLYTLALAGNPAQGAMNRLREKGNLSLTAVWRLAAAYALIGQPEVATQTINGLETNVPKYQENYGTYGSAYRDEAMILETLTILEKKVEALRLYQRISTALGNESVWMSTQTTAFCLLAASKYTQSVNTDQEIQFTYQIPGRPLSEVRSQMSLVQRPLDVQSGRRYTANVTNQTEGDLYARVVLRGTPPMEEAEAVENGLRLQINYKDTNGEPIEPENILQGTDFLAEITVINPGTQGDLQQLALTHIVPSGWEIINTRLQNTSSFYQQDSYEYQDIRDDRVYTYFDLSAGERKTFTLVLNSAYVGRFYQPGIYCEAMYDNTLNVRSEGRWVEVQQP
ncbi:alpha-2-macroglobulin family protein [Tunicatimonas pelagia]|uniref:alpha-2-macroglobulin family protein n=1 Tax=Tunicatimonas pelagia TaxID=931531 RepID=UPI002664F0EB|nr:MG2 domain-containing protein [Tunicatimonas pelagia]WKN41770.1 MG2 domain-containing protein [Tunicatimonas pelagia]